MRKFGIRTLVVVSALALGGPALAGGNFTAHLNGENQVPPFETLAQGPILAPDPNNGCGWRDVIDIIDALESGDTYVNVHTLQSLPGEIRGQVN